MAEQHPGVDSPPASPRGLPQTAASLSLIWLTLGLCLVLTALGVRFAVALDAREVEQHVEASSRGIAEASTQTAYMLPLLNELMKAFTGIQGDIAAGTPMTGERLRHHLWAKPLPELATTSLQLLPRIPAAELQSRASARLQMGLVGNEALVPVVQVDSNGKPATRLSPAEEYFPVVLQSGPDISRDAQGLDRSSLPAFRLAMLMARDTGMLTSYSSFPMSDAASDYFLTFYYFPLYRGGKVPADVEGRRDNFIGFASAYTRSPAKGTIDFLPRAYQGINAVFTSELPRDSSPFGRQVVNWLQSPDVKRSDYQTQGLKFSVVAMASPALAEGLTSKTRWWVLGLGLLATAWMQSMLLWARHQSKKIVALVNERTRDLATRTEALTQANSALVQSEGRYRVLAENISDVIYTCDIDGICTYVSPSVTAQTGYQPDEVFGKPMFDLLEARSVQRIKEAIFVSREEAVGRDYHRTQEIMLRCKDGSIKTFETSLGRLHDERGNVIGVLGVMRDISERKRIEQEQELLRQAYQQSQKMEAIGTLAGGVAHDFNNLLTGVLGHADMLKHDFQGNPESLRSIGLIEMAATRAKDLTGQLLGFARKGKFVQVPVDIHKMISDLVGLLEHTVDKNITITRVSSAGNPVVLGDPGQISQVFLNLAVNARDAMPNGGSLTFKTEIITLDELSSNAGFGLEAGNYCVVSVSDTGIGIASDKIDRIFEPFFTDKEEGKGTGLGLAMVYGVVKNHKGSVRVYSEVGAGSIFQVVLPLHEGVGAVPVRPQSRAPVNGTGRLLLIDDQQLVRQVCEGMLKRLGYEVVTCEDGAEGLEYYREHWATIDVVLTDMIMPKMGGLECLGEMRKINPALKAILCTGYSREDIAEQVKERHILGFIQKPYRLQELSEVVAGVMEQAAASPEQPMHRPVCAPKLAPGS